MLAVDTNVIVRLLIGDDLDQQARARALFDGRPIYISLTVILETEWVLRTNYRFGAPQVVAVLKAIAGSPGVVVEHSDRFSAALDLSLSGMDFADALHLCGAPDGFATFDRGLRKIAARQGIEGVFEP